LAPTCSTRPFHFVAQKIEPQAILRLASGRVEIAVTM